MKTPKQNVEGGERKERTERVRERVQSKPYTSQYLQKSSYSRRKLQIYSSPLANVINTRQSRTYLLFKNKDLVIFRIYNIFKNAKIASKSWSLLNFGKTRTNIVSAKTAQFRMLFCPQSMFPCNLPLLLLLHLSPYTLSLACLPHGSPNQHCPDAPGSPYLSYQHSLIP